MKRILDNLEFLEGSLPGLSGRLDRSRVAAAGHSFGGQTASMLLGPRTIGQDGQPRQDMSEPRIKAGVLLAAGGRGGEALTPFAAEHMPYLNSSFTGMATPTLVRG
jgi:hypothetical protein